jgi:protein O-mannosyl-transferase
VTRRTEALVLAAIVVAVSLPFASSVAFGFTFDDANTILRHRGVAGPLSVDDLLLRDFWGRSYVNTIGSWRPVVTLGYWVDWHLGRGQPWLFHLHNLGLYAALVVVQALFLRRFFGDALGQVSRLVAVGTAGALAIHADVVPSATGRAEIVAALFGLLALLAPLREHGPLRVREVLLTTGACILAAGAKESALPVALLSPLLAYRWHAARGTDRRSAMVALAAANTLALAGIVAFRVLRMPWWDLGPERATENSLLAASPGVRLAGAAEVLVGYLQRLVWPARLAPDYSYAGIVPGHAPVLAAIGVAVAGLAFAVGLLNWKRPPGLSDAAIGFAASYVVVSSAIVPASAIADRLFFFPSFWAVTLVALAVQRLGVRRRMLAGAVSVAFACAQAFAAALDTPRWRDDVSLFTSAIDARPTVVRSRRNLAQALADAGRLEDAAWQLTVANAILDRYPMPLPADAFPTRWDREPIGARLDRLRLRIGPSAMSQDVRRAAATFRHWGNDDVAALLDTWSGGG